MTTKKPARADFLESFNAEAWRNGCVWAFSEEKLRQRFEAETGIKIAAPRSPIEALVDRETGFQDDRLEAFVEWWTVEVWGLDYAPASYQEDLERRGSAIGRIRG